MERVGHKIDLCTVDDLLCAYNKFGFRISIIDGALLNSYVVYNPNNFFADKVIGRFMIIKEIPQSEYSSCYDIFITDNESDIVDMFDNEVIEELGVWEVYAPKYMCLL